MRGFWKIFYGIADGNTLLLRLLLKGQKVKDRVIQKRSKSSERINFLIVSKSLWFFIISFDLIVVGKTKLHFFLHYSLLCVLPLNRRGVFGRHNINWGSVTCKLPWPINWSEEPNREKLLPPIRFLYVPSLTTSSTKLGTLIRPTQRGSWIVTNEMVEPSHSPLSSQLIIAK